MNKVEFIESYIKQGNDYIWNDNHGELIRCKNCKHRPFINGEYENGFSLEFPTNRCPCQCDDGWYNWMPHDDWYCANGERKEE